MKIYPRTHEDFHRRPSDNVIGNIGAIGGSVDELAIKTRDFYSGVNRMIFDSTVKAVWIRGNLTYKDNRYSTLRRNGHKMDSASAFFMSAMVGHSGKFLLNSGIVLYLQSYFDEFFPEFWERNPFEEPEYYAFPYKNISIEHLIFVCLHHDRLTLLQWGEDHAMSIWDFSNWAADQAFSYNEEIGKELYWMSRHDKKKNFPFLRVHLKNKNHGK